MSAVDKVAATSSREVHVLGRANGWRTFLAVMASLPIVGLPAWWLFGIRGLSGFIAGWLFALVISERVTR